LPSRRVAATLVRSYRTISPLPARRSRGTASVGGLFLWHFPAGFPGSISRPPRPVMSGLSSKAWAFAAAWPANTKLSLLGAVH